MKFNSEKINDYYIYVWSDSLAKITSPRACSGLLDYKLLCHFGVSRIKRDDKLARA